MNLASVQDLPSTKLQENIEAACVTWQTWFQLNYSSQMLAIDMKFSRQPVSNLHVLPQQFVSIIGVALVYWLWIK